MPASPSPAAAADPAGQAAGQPVVRFNVEARYSDVAVYGGVCYLAGQVPRNGTADARSQACDVLEQIDALLHLGGSHRGRLLMVTIYLADMADYDALNAAWDAWIAGHPAPPRATVQARLARPEWRIEIVATAAVA